MGMKPPPGRQALSDLLTGFPSVSRIAISASSLTEWIPALKFGFFRAIKTTSF
jgi:hypothetical protein